MLFPLFIHSKWKLNLAATPLRPPGELSTARATYGENGKLQAWNEDRGYNIGKIVTNIH